MKTNIYSIAVALLLLPTAAFNQGKLSLDLASVMPGDTTQPMQEGNRNYHLG